MSRTLQMALDALEDSYLSDEHRNYELQAKAIAALREALATPEPEPWMPIETAPRERSVMLFTPYGLIYCGRKRYGNLGEPQQDEHAWRCDSSGRFANPTHWMPLPAGPGAAPPAAPASQWMPIETAPAPSRRRTALEAAMSNPITLPPLPEPAITMKHGPWKPSQFDDDETYCAHCRTRSIFAHSRRCDPRIDPESLRARDIEVARLVLEAAAKVCRDFHATDSLSNYGLVMARMIDEVEVRHHE